MIKDIMVHLDGTPADEVRLADATAIAETFEGYVTGLFLNILPFPELIEAGYAAAQSTELLQKARDAGDATQAALSKRLQKLSRPSGLRRLDIFWDDVVRTAGREARAADVFVALRPTKETPEAETVIEGVLFGAGRHVVLCPGTRRAQVAFDNILIAWNDSRESARALSEALPYLKRAKAVTLVVVDLDQDREQSVGSNALEHLAHHGIPAVLHQVKSTNSDVATVIRNQARDQNADLIVMGGYGHSRLREWLLGGVTYTLLHDSPIPLLLAH
jgi:nucleotide-binding universal stress UspA family protein